MAVNVIYLSYFSWCSDSTKDSLLDRSELWSTNR